ncbi:MAG TPA: methyltransferase [Clostridia bacterium]|nr:methyltransferase [Clostridia bacterium]
MSIEEIKLGGKSFSFETKPGVFAQYGLDYGSKLLLEVVDFPKTGNILDLGCGCGLLGIAAASLSPESSVYLVDSDIRAINLSKENAERNKIKNVQIILSDIISGLPPELEFDLVVCNPPTHQGKEVLLQFIGAAYQVLKKGGVAYFVVNRMMSVLKKLGKEFGNSEKVIKRKGYIVFKAIK